MTKSKTLRILSERNISDYPEMARLVNAACEAIEIDERLPSNIEELDEHSPEEIVQLLYVVGFKLEDLAERVSRVRYDYDEFTVNQDDPDDIEDDEGVVEAHTDALFGMGIEDFVEHERELPEEEP